MTWYIDPSHSQAVIEDLRREFPTGDVQNVSPANDLPQRFRVLESGKTYMLAIGRALLDDVGTAEHLRVYLQARAIAGRVRRTGPDGHVLVLDMSTIEEMPLPTR
jgi:hypothetical protein